jgi:hypothetical protein
LEELDRQDFTPEIPVLYIKRWAAARALNFSHRKKDRVEFRLQGWNGSIAFY